MSDTSAKGVTVAVHPKVLLQVQYEGPDLGNKPMMMMVCCNACSRSGFLDGVEFDDSNSDTRWFYSDYGYPYLSSMKDKKDKLVHGENCPINAVLNEDGTLKG